MPQEPAEERVERKACTRRRWTVPLLALVALLAAGCTSLRGWSPLPQPWTQAQIAGEQEVRVSSFDRPTSILRSARIESSEDGPRIVGQDGEASQTEVCLPLARVTAIEVQQVDALGVVAVLVILAVIVAGVAMAGGGAQIGTLF